jgi:penicillin-binding protein 1A
VAAEPVPTDAQTGDTIPRPDADQPEAAPAPPPQQMNQDWIDRVIGRNQPRQEQPAGRQPLTRDVPRDRYQDDRYRDGRYQDDRTQDRRYQDERPNQ